jgi:hypothetical protein
MVPRLLIDFYLIQFQNRRNRTKKEGKTLRKKPTNEGATNPLDKLYERMKGYMVDSDSRVSKPSKGGLPDGATEVGSVSSTSQNSCSHFFCRWKLHGMTCQRMRWHHLRHPMPFHRLIHLPAITIHSPAKVVLLISASQSGDACRIGNTLFPSRPLSMT